MEALINRFSIPVQHVSAPVENKLEEDAPSAFGTSKKVVAIAIAFFAAALLFTFSKSIIVTLMVLTGIVTLFVLSRVSTRRVPDQYPQSRLPNWRWVSERWFPRSNEGSKHTGVGTRETNPSPFGTGRGRGSPAPHTEVGGGQRNNPPPPAFGRGRGAQNPPYNPQSGSHTPVGKRNNF